MLFRSTAVDHNERFLVECNGEPAVLILSVADFVKTLAQPPDWLEKSWDTARQRGLEELSINDT